MNRHLHAVTAPVAEDLAAQAEALDEQCPRCGVDSGDTCRNTETGEPMRACHWQRIRAARDERPRREG